MRRGGDRGRDSRGIRLDARGRVAGARARPSSSRPTVSASSPPSTSATSCPVRAECLEYALAQPHRARRVGRRLRTRTAPHPAPPARADPGTPKLTARSGTRCTRRAAARRRRVRETWNGTAPTPSISVSTPSASHSRTCARTSSTVPTSRPTRNVARSTPSSTPGGDSSPQPLEAPFEIALVLAAQRVEPERAPHRRRIAADARARVVEHAQRVPRTRRASTPSTCSSRRRAAPRAAAAGRPSRRRTHAAAVVARARGWFVASSARWCSPS